MLFHYTGARGLLGIIRDATLWATDAHFFNDRSELSYSAEVVTEYLKAIVAVIERREGQRTEFEIRAIQLFRDAAELFKRLSAEAAVYVTCLSSKQDSLSQWRAYGPYSIGFQTAELRHAQLDRSEHESPVHVSPDAAVLVVQRVSYGLDDETKQAIGLILPKLATTAGRLAGDSPEVNALIVPVLSRIKHPSFEDEHEWRLLVTGELDPVDVHFAEGKSAITPHVELALRPGMIGEVIVGPDANASLKSGGVRKLLDRYGHQTAAVSQSESPYRG